VLRLGEQQFVWIRDRDLAPGDDEHLSYAVLGHDVG
jgi:hypothetical protein